VSAFLRSLALLTHSVPKYQYPLTKKSRTCSPSLGETFSCGETIAELYRIPPPDTAALIRCLSHPLNSALRQTRQLREPVRAVVNRRSIPIRTTLMCFKILVARTEFSDRRSSVSLLCADSRDSVCPAARVNAQRANCLQLLPTINKCSNAPATCICTSFPPASLIITGRVNVIT
jgi:hypothetical protein